MTRASPARRGSCEAGLGRGVGGDPGLRAVPLPTSPGPLPVTPPSLPPSVLPIFSLRSQGVAPNFFSSQTAQCGLSVPSIGRPGQTGFDHSSQPSPPLLSGCGVPAARLLGMSGNFLHPPFLPNCTPARDTSAPPCPPPSRAAATPSEGLVIGGRRGRGPGKLLRAFRGLTTAACAERQYPGGRPSSVAFAHPKAQDSFPPLTPPDPIRA